MSKTDQLVGVVTLAVCVCLSVTYGTAAEDAAEAAVRADHAFAWMVLGGIAGIAGGAIFYKIVQWIYRRPRS